MLTGTWPPKIRGVDDAIEPGAGFVGASRLAGRADRARRHPAKPGFAG